MNDTHLARKPGIPAFALACCALWLAGPAAASDVVEVRVGQHATYTRFVVELNEAVSYELSFSQAPGAGEILIVRVPATCRSESKRYTAGFIGEVRVEDEVSGGGCVARLSLRDKHLRISEMVLEGPPRLVLDISGG